MSQGCCLNQLFCPGADDGSAHGALPVVKGIVVVHRTKGRSKPGKHVLLQLCSIAQVDPSTGRGKLSGEARLKHGKKTKHGKTKTLTYRVSFRVAVVDPSGFGAPGAVLVKNGHRHEFFLSSVTLETGDSGRRIHFDCNSWVYPLSKTKSHRVFFSNTSYLPRETPEALRKLRVEELVSLRGDGKGERKKWERVYDYDLYNDLGDPDKGPRHARTVLGGSPAHPYPRRGRTGRPPTRTDPHTERRPGILELDMYVPPDERFSPRKLSEFIKVSAHAIVHFLVPELKSLLLEKEHANFQSFQQMVEDLYSSEGRGAARSMEAWVVDKLNNFLPQPLLHEAVRESKKSTINFPVPQIIAEDKMAWRNDEEFAREMLAGLNPAVIRRLDVFPPMSSTTGSISSIRAFHIEKSLDSLTLEEAMEQGRMFILDHHDYLLPFLRRINAEGVCVYASRTLLFRRDDQTLKPVAIELSLPSSSDVDVEGETNTNRVFLPAKDGIQGALWQLAKVHVAVNDSGHHQLISHWLRTHAVVEPFIIATRRQLSAMHPVHRLLEPHFKDTMQINALARLVLLNAGGVLEKTMFPRRFALELSSAVYKDWRFHDQALPADLLKRGMALEDADEPSGVRLLFDDYPYAADGLEIWCTIKRWVSRFCSVFYLCDEDVASDVEIQAWWEEIRTAGHGDKEAAEDWAPYPLITTRPSLVEALTTLIWIASALHAAVNFGQYGYAGFPANRPIHCRRFIPEEGTAEFAEFMRDPDRYFMAMMPDRFTTTLGLALIEVLSMHTSDELYLGQRASPEWTDNEKVVVLFGTPSPKWKKTDMILLARTSRRRGPDCRAASRKRGRRRRRARGGAPTARWRTRGAPFSPHSSSPIIPGSRPPSVFLRRGVPLSVDAAAVRTSLFPSPEQTGQSDVHLVQEHIGQVDTPGDQRAAGFLPQRRRCHGHVEPPVRVVDPGLVVRPVVLLQAHEGGGGRRRGGGAVRPVPRGVGIHRGGVLRASFSPSLSLAPAAAEIREICSEDDLCDPRVHRRRRPLGSPSPSSPSREKEGFAG